MKMLKLQDLEDCVIVYAAQCAVRDPPKVGRDTGVGGLAPVSQTVGSPFRTP